MTNSSCLNLKLKSSFAFVHMGVAYLRNKALDTEFIKSAVKEAVVKSSKELDFNDLDISLTLDNYWLIVPDLGFGGICYSDSWMQVSIDSKCKKENLQKEFAPMIAHELNHISRMRKYPIENWDDMTCKEDMIQEGIAQVFQEKIYPGSFLYLNKEVLEDKDTWLKKIKPYLDKKRSEYNRNAWFFGDENMPRWIAYTLGYLVVKDYFESHKISLQQLTDIKANKIIK